MAKIKVTSKCEIYDGMSITFQAPCDCNAVDGLTVSDTKGTLQTFTFRDALHNDLANVDNMFVDGAYLTAVLNTRTGFAYLQNSATNAHLEYQSFTKDETLMDHTKALYGLSPSATPNDVFMALKMPAGYYGFTVTAKFSDGTPATGLELKGLLAFDQSVAITDENGFCFAMSTESTPVVDFTNYIGIVSKTVTLQAIEGVIYTPIEIVVEKDPEMKLFQTSGEYRVYKNALIDICAVGGGGSAPICNTKNFFGFTGGGGGYAVNALGLVDVERLVFTIGAGGGYSSSTLGNDGGATSVTKNGELLITANGGGRGGNTTNYGIGNGNGGCKSAGGNGTVRVFDDPTLPLPGGGGGGVDTNKNVYPGGLDFGGSGKFNSGGENGKGPGGGGGACAIDISTTAYGGAGAAGGVYVRARFVS